MCRLSDNPSILHSGAEGVLLPRASLPAWSTDESIQEVSLDQLATFDRIMVTTQNHPYEVVVTSPGSANVVVRGGGYFPNFTPARLAGSSLGGNFLKTRCVTVGLRLEFTAPGGRAIITTRVRSIRVIPSEV
jgi:hypothetical protein